MNNVNKTLYIPLYGKAFVSKRGIILKDKSAETIWEKEGFSLRGKSKSKWLSYYMAMRSRVYDEWVACQIKKDPSAVVLHIGCGMDSRILRVDAKSNLWYDVDFPEVIEERRKYFSESDLYHMCSFDMRQDGWKKEIRSASHAIIILEGVSMYFEKEELTSLLSGLSEHFKSVSILMDCYTEKAARISKYKNPINDVGVTKVFGYDDPSALAERSGICFTAEHNMTPMEYIEELSGAEKAIFKRLFAGKISRAMYRMYEFEKTGEPSL